MGRDGARIPLPGRIRYQGIPAGEQDKSYGPRNRDIVIVSVVLKPMIFIWA